MSPTECTGSCANTGPSDAVVARAENTAGRRRDDIVRIRLDDVHVDEPARHVGWTDVPEAEAARPDAASGGACCASSVAANIATATRNIWMGKEGTVSSPGRGRRSGRPIRRAGNCRNIIRVCARLRSPRSWHPDGAGEAGPDARRPQVVHLRSRRECQRGGRQSAARGRPVEGSSRGRQFVFHSC